MCTFSDIVQGGKMQTTGAKMGAGWNQQDLNQRAHSQPFHQGRRTGSIHGPLYR